MKSWTRRFISPWQPGMPTRPKLQSRRQAGRQAEAGSSLSKRCVGEIITLCSSFSFFAGRRGLKASCDSVWMRFLEQRLCCQLQIFHTLCSMNYYIACTRAASLSSNSVLYTGCWLDPVKCARACSMFALTDLRSHLPVPPTLRLREDPQSSERKGG